MFISDFSQFTHEWQGHCTQASLGVGTDWDYGEVYTMAKADETKLCVHITDDYKMKYEMCSEMYLGLCEVDTGMYHVFFNFLYIKHCSTSRQKLLQLFRKQKHD